MGFSATLAIDGLKEMRLLHFSYSLQREVDSIGRPSGTVRGGSMQFEVESTADTKLFEWIVSQHTSKNGKVTFYPPDSDKSMKELSWEKGFIIQFSESIDAIGENPMSIHFVVSAEKIKIGGGTHTNPWPKA